MQRLNPPTVPKPGSLYSQGVVHSLGGRRLVVAGQVGARLDGSVPDSLEEQIALAFDHFMAVVRAAGMGPEHVVRICAYALSPAALPPYRVARDRVFAGHPVAATYLQVSALASPAYLFEVDGEAVQES